jgi:hypothetical protein
MTQSLVFAPLVPWPLVWGLLAAAVVLVGIALWRGLAGWWLRGLALGALLAALANPALQHEDRRPLSDIVIVVVDDSASQRIADRPAQTEAALAALEAEIATLENTELRVVRLGDGPDNAGTLAMAALAEAVAQ